MKAPAGGARRLRSVRIPPRHPSKGVFDHETPSHHRRRICRNARRAVRRPPSRSAGRVARRTRNRADFARAFPRDPSAALRSQPGDDEGAALGTLSGLRHPLRAGQCRDDQHRRRLGRLHRARRRAQRPALRPAGAGRRQHRLPPEHSGPGAARIRRGHDRRSDPARQASPRAGRAGRLRRPATPSSSRAAASPASRPPPRCPSGCAPSSAATPTSGS